MRIRLAPDRRRPEGGRQVCSERGETEDTCHTTDGLNLRDGAGWRGDEVGWAQLKLGQLPGLSGSERGFECLRKATFGRDTWFQPARHTLATISFYLRVRPRDFRIASATTQLNGGTETLGFCRVGKTCPGFGGIVTTDNRPGCDVARATIWPG